MNPIDRQYQTAKWEELYNYNHQQENEMNVQTKPVVKLIGNDGNAFCIIGACRKAARRAGWSDDEWQKVQTEMTSGDYDDLLCTAMKYFDVE